MRDKLGSAIATFAQDTADALAFDARTIMADLELVTHQAEIMNQLYAEKQRFRTMFERLEWCKDDGACPVCYRHRQHATNCELDKLLKEDN